MTIGNSGSNNSQHRKLVTWRGEKRGGGSGWEERNIWVIAHHYEKKTPKMGAGPEPRGREIHVAVR